MRSQPKGDRSTAKLSIDSIGRELDYKTGMTGVRNEQKEWKWRTTADTNRGVSWECRLVEARKRSCCSCSKWYLI